MQRPIIGPPEPFRNCTPPPAAGLARTGAFRVEKDVTLDAPRTRVWRALTDVEQFDSWFGLALTAPFVAGTAVSWQLKIRGYEHVTLTLWIESMEPEHRFAFRWHPYALEAGVDYAAEPTTPMTFTLDDAEGGTRLRIVEAGFDAIPESRGANAFAMNTGGWNGQAENIRKYLAR